MQFELKHKIGDTFINVEFKTDIVTLKLLSIESLKQTFQRIGDVFQDDYTFNFPLYITSEVISEVIHNTCFVCGGLMQDKMKMLTYEEDPNSLTKNIRVCSQCGHSHT